MSRRRILASLAVHVFIVAIPALASADAIAEAVCSRLIATSVLSQDVGPGLAPVGFSDADAGFWNCRWSTASEPPRVLMARYNIEGRDKARARYDEHIARLKASGRPHEPVTGVGLAAALVPLGEAMTLAVHAPDAFITITAMSGVSRTQVLAVARRLAAVTPATLEAARTGLAAARAAEPPPTVEEVVVRRNGQPLPCEQLVPRGELTAIVGPAYRLAHADDPRPGMSFCEWKRTEQDYPITVRVAGEPEFRDARMSGPAEFFSFEVDMASCKDSGRVLQGLGEQARQCSSGDRHHIVVIRRAKDVIVVTCPDCASDAAVALAKAAVQ
jgi:hypothetical protein